MLAQLRIYDIKPDLMEQWLTLFRDKVVPMHAKFDLPVLAAWVDTETSQFVWVRGFAGDGTIEEQETRYRNSEERARVIGDEPKRFIERMQVRDLEQVYPIG
ncbi:hypothetical protein HC028_23665 [Planosporangium flavigriseum]|uniref:NIPSNAP domain-containing protein n=1 Tax=Planosporangium flavigriseum TaxID=373681 RepID=A0A8J3LXX9_9ACTN|nr:NIPSNAP family protein [Planosporangium flavigriseum]NJC67474.1 hypothetical protein [Planosporangium flavigriseum]GIG75576.1 hypothetical protein Pfl04_39800 [Planosporangium flavigriseum]